MDSIKRKKKEDNDDKNLFNLIPGRIYISCCRYFNQEKKKEFKILNLKKKYTCTKSNPKLIPNKFKSM